MVMKLTILGSGGPFPGPSLKRMSSGYVIKMNSEVMVFDHGPGAYHRLLETGLTASRVSRVVFSHLHYDHCADFVRLLLNRWHWGGRKTRPLKVYGPPGTIHFVDRLFGPDGAFKADLTARIANPEALDPGLAWPRVEVEELHEDDTVEDSEWRLTLATVPHLQPHLTCYGYRLENERAVFAYSGDCAPCLNMQRLAVDADVLVHVVGLVSGGKLVSEGVFAPHRSASDADPSRMSRRGVAERQMARAREVAELARDAGVGTLVATHAGATIDRPGIRERLVGEMKAIFPGRLVWAEDLMVIEVEGKNPKRRQRPRTR